MNKCTLLVLLLGLSACSSLPIQDKKMTRLGGTPIEYAYIHHGTPTIVFLSGFTGPMDDWQPVYSVIGKMHSVFAYNRFGYGNSGEVSGPQSARVIASYLHALLLELKIQPPYVLVGHSFGAVYANMYAQMYPKEIIGAVFVDPAHPEQFTRLEESGFDLGILFRTYVAIKSLHHPDIYSELQNFNQSEYEIFKAGEFPPVPLIVITSGHTLHGFMGGMYDTLQKQLARLSPHGKQIYAINSSHNVMRDAPNIVIKAIDEVIRHGR